MSAHELGPDCDLRAHTRPTGVGYMHHAYVVCRFHGKVEASCMHHHRSHRTAIACGKRLQRRAQRRLEEAVDVRA